MIGGDVSVKKIKLILSAWLCATGLHATPSMAQLIDFDTIASNVPVNSYYSGGQSGDGVTGPVDYGIDFGGDWRTTEVIGGSSAPNFAYSFSGNGVINFYNGFETGLNFRYGAFAPAFVFVYDGYNATGNLLAAIFLPANNVFHFDFVVLPFDTPGTAHSIMAGGGAQQFGWDDITFGSLTSAVPEPAGWTVMLLGFGLGGAALRQGSRVRSRVSLSA
jgi:hypothetical protein